MTKAHLQDIIELADLMASESRVRLEAAYSTLISDDAENRIYEAIRDAALTMNGLEDFKSNGI